MSSDGRSTAATVWGMIRTPLTLLVLLAILGFGGWWGYQKVMAPVPPRPPTPCIDQAIRDGNLQSQQVTVRVFNGGTQRGLAGEVASTLRSHGFTVGRTDNTDEAVTTTVIVGLAEDLPEVRLVQSFFPDSTIRVDPARTDRVVEVLVGDEFTPINTSAAESIPVDSTTICLPEINTEAAG